jgi:cobalamin synthase
MAGLALGTHVPVAYLPERPKSARVSTRKYRLYPIVGLFFGAMLWLGVAAGCVLTR